MSVPPATPEIDVNYVADLARISLSPEEASLFQKQLADVLGYVNQLAEVDVSQVSLLGEVDLENKLRADILQPSLTAEEALANAPAKEDNLFQMPRIVE
jgi:aspartyl-tRNA(Asn)/glutamyl-tRNA(Gln) amidotransferase subunit C